MLILRASKTGVIRPRSRRTVQKSNLSVTFRIRPVPRNQYARILAPRRLHLLHLSLAVIAGHAEL